MFVNLLALWFLQNLILSCTHGICDTTKEEFVMEVVHLTLKIRAMYTTQHAHSTTQAALIYWQAPSINDDDTKGSASEI